MKVMKNFFFVSFVQEISHYFMMILRQKISRACGKSNLFLCDVLQDSFQPIWCHISPHSPDIQFDMPSYVTTTMGLNGDHLIEIFVTRFFSELSTKIPCIGPSNNPNNLINVQCAI